MARDVPAAEPRRPIRLLWLIDSLTAGGAEALVPAFARAVDPTRLRLHVCALKTLDGNPFQTELEASGVAVSNLEARNLRDLDALGRLRSLVQTERIDLIHAHLTYAIIWGCATAARTGLGCVATLHTLPGSWPLASRERLRQSLMCSALNRWCDRILAVSEAVRKSFLEQRALDPSKLTVVHNGIDVGAFGRVPIERVNSLRAELGVPPAARVVTTLTVLREGKGLEILLAAAQEVVRQDPRALFLVAGDGPRRQRLERRCRRLGLDGRVRWLGWRRDVPELLAASDLFVLPSLWDAYPTSLLEAMAAGLPAVATAVGGIPEILGDGDGGRLVPAGRPEPLADALLELLADPEASRSLGATARNRARREFSTRSWVARLERVYASVLGQRGELRPLPAEAVS